MSHEITAKDVFGEVRARGDRAWHGLGVEIPDGLGAWEGFQKIGLDWETELIPVTVNYQGTPITDPEFQMHIRRDTKESLGIVGSKYHAISNRRLADFADTLCGLDKAIILETAGSLRGGRRVFATIRLPKDIEVVDGDVLNMYVVGSNAHDGSAAFQWYASSIRVVCANTLAMSEHSANGMVRFQHSGDIEAKVEMVRSALGLCIKETEKYEQEVRALAKRHLTKDQITAYMEAVYDTTFGKIQADWPEKMQQTRAAHKQKTVALWLTGMDAEHQTIKGIEGTAWAAFNAFSEWSDHERGRFMDVDSSDARVHSNLFGVSNNDKKKAWQKALALVA